jgi:CRP-like cAMP-binding protein
LNEKVLSRLLPHMEKSIVASGEYIHQSGDDVHYVYFPETAVLSEYQMLEDGRTIELTMTGREGVNGLEAVFGAATAANWTQALIGGSVMKININIIQKEFNRGGTLQVMFLGFINDYVRRISQRAICNNHHLIEERLCNWLLMLCDRHKSDTLPITQEQIAYFLGVHRPSVTLVAQSLRERKIIDYVRGQIFILDRQALENSACSCYPVTKIT